MLKKVLFYFLWLKIPLCTRDVWLYLLPRRKLSFYRNWLTSLYFWSILFLDNLDDIVAYFSFGTLPKNNSWNEIFKQFWNLNLRKEFTKWYLTNLSFKPSFYTAHSQRKNQLKLLLSKYDLNFTSETSSVDWGKTTTSGSSPLSGPSSWPCWDLKWNKKSQKYNDPNVSSINLILRKTFFHLLSMKKGSNNETI